MATITELSNKTLNAFRAFGFTVYETPHENLLSIVKYYHEEPKAPLLIQFDFSSNTLLVVQQNIFQNERTLPLYNAPIPPQAEDMFKVLKYTKVINSNLYGALTSTL